MGFLDKLRDLGARVGISFATDELSSSPFSGLGDALLTLGAEALNVRTVAVQFVDPSGINMTKPCAIQFWLSSDAFGQTPVAATTSLAAGTNGTFLVEDVNNSVVTAVSEANGTLDIAIGDVGVASYYLNILMPNGQVKTSAIISFV